MSGLFDIAQMEHSAELVQKELDALLERARGYCQRVDEAAGQPHEPGLRVLMELELQHVARALTRAQAVLVHHSDPRHAAALAVLGYCDAADARAALDGHSVRIGA